MKENRIYTGKWFLADKPEIQVFGTLSFSEEWKPLLLVFEKFAETNSFKFDQFPQITGHVYNQTDKEAYTIELIELIQTGQKYGSSINFTYQANEYLIVKGLKPSSPLKFKEIRLHTDILNDWIKPARNIKYSMPDKSEFNIAIDYNQPKSIKLFENDTLSVYFYFRANYTINVNRSGIINESRWINLEFKKEVALDEFHKLVSSFENLFTLLFNSQLMFTSIELKDINNTIFTHYFAGRKENFITNKTSRQATDFDNFKHNSQKIIGEWFKKEEELKLLVNNFFTAFGNKAMYTENRFIAYVSLLEQYHKLRFNDYEPKGEKYITMYNKAITELKGDTLSWVKARLDEKSEIRLKTRLSDLIEKFILPINDDKLDKIINTRNHYIHLDKSITDIFSIEELVIINQLLEESIIGIFYKEINIKKQ